MIELFLLVIVCIIGSIAVYQDIRTGKVKNKLILIGLWAGIAGYFLLATQALFFLSPGLAYFKKIFINVSISWTLSFFIWYIGLWSAGDAKIFMLFSFLLPLRFYGESFPISFFPAAGLLINAFILVIFFITLEILFRILRVSFNFILKFHAQKETLVKKFSFAKKHLFEKIKEDKGKYLKIAIIFLCLFLVLSIYRISIRKELAKVLSGFEDFFFIVVILGFRLLMGLFKKINQKVLYFLLLFLLIVNFFSAGSLTKAYFMELATLFINFIRIAMSLFIVFGILEMYFRKKEEVKIRPQSISPKMVLSRESVKKLNNYFQKNGLKEKFYADGLTPQQVELIKDSASKNSDFNELSIYKTFPLVPFVFLGTLATIIARGIILDLDRLSSICRMIIGRLL